MTDQGPSIDLFVDLNAEDETGLPWSLLTEAADPDRVVPGAHIVIGSGRVRAVALVVDVTIDGVVHVKPLPGPVSAYADLMGSRGAA
jgi:hypothetical protein